MVAGAMLQGFQAPTHKFSTEDKTRLISLNQEFLAISDKKYIRWNDFRHELHQIEEAFRETYGPPFYQRLGLRYRNIVDRNQLQLKSESWAALLNQSLIGSLGSADLANDITETRNQTLIKLPNGSNDFIRLVHGLPKGATNLYVIDVDIFSEERREITHAFESLDHFNTSAFKLFRWCITNRLRDVLEPTPSE